MARRKLPPLPADVDPTEAEAIPALLSLFVEQLPGAYSAHTESAQFRTLVEVEYPAAWKAYTESHWAQHFYERLTAEISRQRQQSRRSNRTANNKGRANKRPITELSHSVDNHGNFKRLMSMTRADIVVIRSRYESTVKSDLVHIAFLRRIEKRLKLDTERVEERWSEAELETLSDSLYGPDAGPVVP
jgi:hypothetical protein